MQYTFIQVGVVAWLEGEKTVKRTEAALLLVSIWIFMETALETIISSLPQIPVTKHNSTYPN